MKKIKVLNIIWSMGAGGAQRIVLNYLKDFKDDKDIEFKLLVYDKCTNSYCNEIIKENNYNVEYLNNKKSMFNLVPILRKKFNFKTAQKTFEQAIKKYNPDIVHVHISPLLTYVLDPILNCNVPIKFDTLHSNPKRQQGKDLEYIRRAFQNSGFIPICLNEEQKKIAEEHYGFKKYEIVRNGIDIEKIKKSQITREAARKIFKIKKNDFVIIGVGRLNRIKRFDLLIEYFNECTKKNKKAKLYIAGEGPEYNNLLELINKLNLNNKVILLGNVDNITDLYYAADVLAMTSESEASPLTLIEAQVCKLRCVVSAGVPEESIVTNMVKKMPESASITEWSDALLDTKFKGKKVVDMKVYDVKNASKQMKKVYLKYWKKYNEKK